MTTKMFDALILLSYYARSFLTTSNCILARENLYTLRFHDGETHTKYLLKVSFN